MNAKELRKALRHVRSVIEDAVDGADRTGQFCPLCVLRDMGHIAGRDYQITNPLAGELMGGHAKTKGFGLAMVDASLAALPSLRWAVESTAGVDVVEPILVRPVRVAA